MDPDSDGVDLLDSAKAINNMPVKAEALVKLLTSTNHYHKLCGSLTSILHIIPLIKNTPISTCIQRRETHTSCWRDV